MVLEKKKIMPQYDSMCSVGICVSFIIYSKRIQRPEYSFINIQKGFIYRLASSRKVK